MACFFSGKAEPTQQLALPWQQPDVYDTSDEEDTGDKETRWDAIET